MNLICFPFGIPLADFQTYSVAHGCYDAVDSELRPHSWSYQANSLQILRLSRYRPSMDTNAKLIR